MQKLISGYRVFVSAIRSRGFALGLLAVMTAFLVFWIASRVRPVRIIEGNNVTTLHTALADPADILDSLGIEPKSSDRVTTSGFHEGFFGNMNEPMAEIKIENAVDVSILADALTYHVTVAAGSTVGDAIYASGLTIRTSDYLDAPTEKPVKEGDSIRLTRVDYILTTEEETIERGKTVRGTSLIKSNRSVLLVYGKNGKMLKTYEQKVVDGEMKERVLISEDVIKKPTDDVYIIGDGSAISPLDYGYTIENGAPTSFQKVYSNVRATGYYAKAGSGTASGRLAQVGYVAVDPKVIPYGTKLWIVGHGSSTFVYGYALAADTGGAMLSGKNFVDLYYDTYYECVLNGVKYVDVYVLE